MISLIGAYLSTTNLLTDSHLTAHDGTLKNEIDDHQQSEFRDSQKVGSYGKSVPDGKQTKDVVISLRL